MREFLFGGLVAAAAFVGVSSSALASGLSSGSTCDALATASADHAVKDQMQFAGQSERSVPGKVLVIAAGQKFYMPQRQTDDGVGAPTSVWQRMRNWNAAYSDAFWNCKHEDTIIIINR